MRLLEAAFPPGAKEAAKKGLLQGEKPEEHTAGAKRLAEKLASAGILGSFVTGHDFSRAASATEPTWASAPGMDFFILARTMEFFRSL